MSVSHVIVTIDGGVSTETMPYAMPSARLMAAASRDANPSVFGTSNNEDSAPELAAKDDTAYAVPAAFGAITNGPAAPVQLIGLSASSSHVKFSHGSTAAAHTIPSCALVRLYGPRTGCAVIVPSTLSNVLRSKRNTPATSCAAYTAFVPANFQSVVHCVVPVPHS